MTEELDLLYLVCKRLDKANIPYMLTGSFAANFYAVPRMTRDIDIIIEIDQSDINKIVHIFQNDFYLEKDSIIEALEFQNMFNIIHNDSAYKVDFIIRKNSPYRLTEFNRRKQILLNNIPIWIVTLEDLIISKLFWAKDSFSEMQVRDIKNLLQTSQHIDKEYIDKWIEKLGLQNIYEKVKIDA